jgi:hypothetical protein
MAEMQRGDAESAETDGERRILIDIQEGEAD